MLVPCQCPGFPLPAFAGTGFAGMMTHETDDLPSPVVLAHTPGLSLCPPSPRRRPAGTGQAPASRAEEHSLPYPIALADIDYLAVPARAPCAKTPHPFRSRRHSREGGGGAAKLTHTHPPRKEPRLPLPWAWGGDGNAPGCMRFPLTGTQIVGQNGPLPDSNTTPPQTLPRSKGRDLERGDSQNESGQ